MHGLARVEVEHVADPVSEAQRVWRGVWEPGGGEALELAARKLQPALVLVSDPGLANLLGDPGTEVGRESLPLAGEQPVTLQVAEAAVVGDDLEPVPDRLPASPGTVPAG